MKAVHLGVVAAVVVTPLLLGRVFDALAEDGVRQIPVDPPQVHKAEMTTFMQAKLTGSQQLLEGLVSEDYERIGKAAEVLMLTSLGEPKLKSSDEFKDQVFDHFKLEFQRLSGKLQEMAEAKNLEGAAYVYQNLTATCIACHQHIRRSDTRASKN